MFPRATNTANHYHIAENKHDSGSFRHSARTEIDAAIGCVFMVISWLVR